jgi:hypothetical protein
VVNILIDLNSFWTHENRESLVIEPSGSSSNSMPSSSSSSTSTAFNENDNDNEADGNDIDSPDSGNSEMITKTALNEETTNC